MSLVISLIQTRDSLRMDLILMISQFLVTPAEWVLWFGRKCLDYWMDCQRNIVKCSCPQNFISPCAAVVCDQIPDKLM